MSDPLKLGIAVPAYGSHLDIGHKDMWLSLGAALATSQDKFELVSNADYHINGIDHCRNVMTLNALAAGCDWLFMVDADTYHAVPDSLDGGIDILQMLWTAHTASAAIVGAPVRGRSPEKSGYMALRKQGVGFVQADTPSGEVVEVSRIATAFFAVNLDWLHEHWPDPPWFKMTYTWTAEQVEWLGEDYGFCDEVSARGGKILLDCRFFPEHVAGRQLVKG